jgi:catechol 2,3-dioxygenase-like lactoylglutathione lyase family enzyme
MQITLASISVEDQQRALTFYTEILGFEKRGFPPPHSTCGNLINLVQPAG